MQLNGVELNLNGSMLTMTMSLLNIRTIDCFTVNEQNTPCILVWHVGMLSVLQVLGHKPKYYPNSIFDPMMMKSPAITKDIIIHPNVLPKFTVALEEKSAGFILQG